MKFKYITGFVFYTLILFIIFMLNFNLTYSFENNFETLNGDFSSFSTPFEFWTSDITACKCSISTQQIFILNLEESSVFKITLEGPASKWADLSENDFFLNTGENKNIYINYNIPCDAKSQDIIIKVKSLKNEEIINKYKINIGDCQNLQIIPIKTFDQACPCEDLDFSFKISNIGNFRETYELESTKFNEDFIFIPSEITLNPLEEATIYAFLNKNCGTHGTFKFDIRASASGSKQSVVFQNTAKIDHCYDNSLRVGKIQQNFEVQNKPFELCKNQFYKIPFIVENSANLNNQFILGINGDKYARLNRDDIILKSNSEAVLFIEYYPTKEENKFLYLSSNGVLGDTQNNVRIPVIINNCYDLNILTPKKIYVNQPYISIYLENVGTEKINSLVTMSENDNFILSEKKINISNREVLDIKVNQNLNNRVEKIDIYFKLNNGNIESKRFHVIFGTPLFYTYKWYILLSIIFIILFVLLVLYLVQKRKNDFGIKCKKTNKIVNCVELSVNDSVLEPVENEKFKKNKTKVSEKNNKKKEIKNKKEDISGLKIRQYFMIIIGILILISLVVLLFVYRIEIFELINNTFDNLINKFSWVLEKFPENITNNITDNFTISENISIVKNISTNLTN